ncbi:DUF4349 domain-containing protein [Streptomyces sp. NPDC047028]|uniref:DUF4349 domain-containing protein n=1 Tax=Streptomyces sp. NPDC047028 TaxID=3155793 RepID=UPI0033DBCD28
MCVPRSASPVRILAGLLLAASLALAGCSAGDSSSNGGSAKSAARGQAQDGAGGGPAADAGSTPKVPKTPRLRPEALVRTASLTVRVKDVPEALGTARHTAEDAGGYVGDESTSLDSDGHEQTRLVLRVPGDHYDEVLTALQGTGKLVHRVSKAEDVTDQVVDIDSRVKSQRASVARIRALMDRATRLSDVVSLEGELSSREADLESLLARQASLKDRTTMATITLSLSETPAKKAAAHDDGPGFADALAGGWHVFVTLLVWIALAVGAVLPFAALAALLYVVWRRIVRRLLPARPAPDTSPKAGGDGV